MSRFSMVYVAGLVLAAGMPLRGDVITAVSGADLIDVGLDLQVLGGSLVNADLNGLVPANGAAPLGYNETATLLSVNEDVGNVLGIVRAANVTSGTVTSLANSNVDGLPGSRVTDATHTIEDLDLSIGTVLGVLGGPDLISITAEAISVTSAISGDLGSIAAVGTMTVTNLQVFVAGVAVTDSILGVSTAINVGPNYGIDLSTVLGGVSLMLNQQVLTGDGLTSQGLITNAISLDLTNVGVDNILGIPVATLDGNVTVGLTQASVTGFAPAAVPEPSSCLLLGMVGLGGLFHQRRRRARAAEGMTAA